MTYEDRVKILKKNIDTLEANWKQGKSYDRENSDLLRKILEIAVTHGKICAGEDLADKWNKSIPWGNI